jgi:tetratricopeptide (TPR) repeat protein
MGVGEAAYPQAMALLRTGAVGPASKILSSLLAAKDGSGLAFALLLAVDDPRAALPLLAAASRDGGDQAAMLAAALPVYLASAAAAERAMLVGRAALREGLSEVALAAFTAALTAEPDWPQALAHRAYARFRLGEPELALADAAAALKADPAEATAYQVRGLVLLRTGDAEGARDALEKAHTADPRNAAILCDLAEAYTALHAYEQAQSDLTAAVRLDPTSPVPLMRLARFHLSTLLNAEAGLSAANEAARLSPDSA